MEALNLNNTKANFLTNKYHFVSSVELVNELTKHGFELSKQNKVRLRQPIDPSLSKDWNSFTEEEKSTKLDVYNKRLNRFIARKGHEKHFLRFTNPYLKSVITGHELFIRTTNSYDGTSSFIVSLDMTRLVCFNGLVAPRELFSIRVRHNNKNIVREVIAATQTIINRVTLLKDQINLMQSTKLSYENKLSLLKTMLELRFSDRNDIKLENNLHLIVPKREEEQVDSAYQIFNTIQENLVRGARINVEEKGVIKDFKAREIRSVSSTDKFNDLSWTTTLNLCKTA